MSRRTKLTIAAFLLVLLGLGMAGYLYFSWSAQEPLRFRVVGKGTPVEAADPEQRGAKAIFVPYEIEVVNTQPFAIYLDTAYIDIFRRDLLPAADHSPAVKSVNADDLVDLGEFKGARRVWDADSQANFYAYADPPISSYGIIRRQLLVKEDLSRVVDWTKVQVSCSWVSLTKNRVHCFYGWMHRRAPEWTARTFKDLPNWEGERTTVDGQALHE